MKVLWITNILFPEAVSLLTGSGELRASGGWMLGASEALLQHGGVELYVATVSPKVSELTRLQGEKITYYLLPLGKGNQRINKEYEPYWKRVQTEVQPDVVHIHGTEYSQGYSYMTACGADNVVISIQGLTSAYYYYYYGMTKCDIFRNLTVRDLLKGTVIKGQRDFKRRSKYEIAAIKLARHIIGRTSWDKARVWALNPDAQYHFCNETLRPEFYDGLKWDYDSCTKHSIFVSQASYPIKGLHQLLRAMPLILQHYPDTTIRVAGDDVTRLKSAKDLIHY